MTNSFDIIIVGAGPAGLSFALSLKDSGQRILLIDKQSEEQLAQPAYDGRDLALTHLTRRIMRDLGTWQRIPEESISFIEEARVLDGDSPLSLDFDAPKEEGMPLGYMISNHHIRAASYAAVRELENVTLICGQEVTEVSTSKCHGSVTLANGERYTAALIVAADTRFSDTRRKMGIGASMRDYGHSAIVCRVAHEKPHDNVAWEIFQYGRTLAVLPQHDRQSSIVITVPGNKVEELMAQDAETFTFEVSRHFEHRLGAMELISERHSYPLVGVHARSFYKTRFALIGDAAVGMHPVTAHGFNLGLRGGATLARLVGQAVEQGEDIAGTSLLWRYERIHMRATRVLYHGTNFVVSLFTDDSTPARTLRKGVLGLSRLFPPVRWAIQQKLGEMREPISMLQLRPRDKPL